MMLLDQRCNNQSAHADSANAGFDMFDDERDNDKRHSTIADASDFIVDIREFDVPYHVRVAIDKGLHGHIFSEEMR